MKPSSRTFGKTLVFTLVLVSLMLISSVQADTTIYRYEYYVSGDDGYLPIAEYVYGAQTFTPQTNHSLVYVELKLFRLGNVTGPKVAVRATSSGVPAGGDLAYGYIFDLLTTNTTGVWYRAILDHPVPVVVNTTYAIVLSYQNGLINTDNVNWRFDSAGSSYARGNRTTSFDYGVTWPFIETGIDFMFAEYGVGEPPGNPEYLLPSWTAPVTATGIVFMALAGSFWKIGDKMGDHGTAGFLIGAGTALILTFLAGLVPIWIVFAGFACAFIAVFFWLRSG